jgi:tRNA (adenine37-N6)-methyltransferase
VTVGGDVPVPQRPGLQVIGVVRTGRSDLDHTPVQSALNAQEMGTVELDDRFAAALEGLEGFDYAWLLSWLGRPGDGRRGPIQLRQVPFLLRRRPRAIGVFATRGPRRINPIGLSLVRIVEVGPATVRFAGVDLVDGTPLLDIKPFVARLTGPRATSGAAGSTRSS